MPGKSFTSEIQSGPNTGLVVVPQPLDATGMATLSYTSAVAGIDSYLVWLDLNGNAQKEASEPQVGGTCELGLRHSDALARAIAASGAPDGAGANGADPQCFKSPATCGMTRAPINSIERMVVAWSMRDSCASINRCPMPISR